MTESYYNEFEGRKPFSFWNIINRVMISAIIVALCIAGALVFIPILKQQGEELEHQRHLEAEIKKETALLAKQSREVELLKNDPEYISIIARDKLNVMKPGETILRLDAPKAAR